MGVVGFKGEKDDEFKKSGFYDVLVCNVGMRDRTACACTGK